MVPPSIANAIRSMCCLRRSSTSLFDDLDRPVLGSLTVSTFDLFMTSFTDLAEACTLCWLAVGPDVDASNCSVVLLDAACWAVACFATETGLGVFHVGRGRRRCIGGGLLFHHCCPSYDINDRDLSMMGSHVSRNIPDLDTG